MPGGTERMLVAHVDVDGPLPELSGGPTGYPAAWVIAMRDGRPVGHVEIPFTGARIDASVLGERLAALPGVGAPVPGPPAVPDAALPRVTVVVPTTFDRVEWLTQCVECLVRQDYPDFDVVVVDNRPDGTPERAALWARLCAYDARVSVIAEPYPGSSAARNAGVRAATGDVIAFADDDVLIAPGWLRAIGTCFATAPELGAVTGAILPKELETRAQVWFQRSGSTYDQHYETVGFTGDTSWRGRFLGGVRPGRFQLVVRRGAVEERLFLYRAGKLGASGSMAVRASVLCELGGFDELLGAGAPVPGGEDLLLLVRLVFAGYGLRLEPAAYVRHTHWRTHEEFLGKIRSYGIGYTAMLCALIRTDSRHILGLGYYGVQAVVLLLRKFSARGRPAASEYPPEFSRAELRGLLAGPWTYVTALRRARRRPAAGPARTPEEALR